MCLLERVNFLITAFVQHVLRTRGLMSAQVQGIKSQDEKELWSCGTENPAHFSPYSHFHPLPLSPAVGPLIHHGPGTRCKALHSELLPRNHVDTTQSWQPCYLLGFSVCFSTLGSDLTCSVGIWCWVKSTRTCDVLINY